MLNTYAQGIITWPQHAISEADWKMSLPADVAEEVLESARILERNPLPLPYLDPSDYPLDACKSFAKTVQSALRDGVRFVLIDRLPVNEVGRDVAIQLYWLLSLLIGRPVAQKLDGTLLYDVRDKGKPPAAGSGVRPADTNYEQLPHTDNAFNAASPEVVGLLCIKNAREGGISRCLSFYNIHNQLLRSAPDLLERLYQPFPHDRQKEFWPDESPIIEHPIFRESGGRLHVKFSPHQIRNAYQMLGRDMDDLSARALAAVEKLCRDPANWIEFSMEPGQIQYVNNLEAGHARGAFVDFEAPDEKRHMVRIWLRDAGRPDYCGSI